MKKIIILQILKEIKSRPKLMRKLRILAVIGLVIFVSVSSLAIWAGFSALTYVAQTTNQLINDPIHQSQIQTVLSDFNRLQFKPSNCWEKAQSMLAPKAWLEQNVSDNFHGLKVACMDLKPTVCDSLDCSKKIEQLINTSEGRRI